MIPYNLDITDINVTNMVKEMILNPNSNYGFIIMQRIEDPWRCMNFASGVCPDTSKRPLLEITYSTVGISTISNLLPAEFKLHQNFPNPFNPVTKIEFEIPKSSFTNIEIFDVLGREVESLVNEKLEAGIYSVDWNGNKYSSGEYFYRIAAGDFIETKRMTLIK